CRAIAPVVEEIAREYAGKLKVMKMNVDDNPQTPSRYGVRGIPNLILFQGGQVKEQIVGAVPKSQLLKAISSVVAQRGRRWREQRGRRLRFSCAGRARCPGHAGVPAQRRSDGGPAARAARSRYPLPPLRRSSGASTRSSRGRRRRGGRGGKSRRS